MFKARNHEFFRDKAAFGWNFVFPFLIVVGFGIVFGGDTHNTLKVGIVAGPSADGSGGHDGVGQRLGLTRYLVFIPVDGLEQGLDKLRHHKIDILVEEGRPPYRYWVDQSSPKGYMAERLLRESLMSGEPPLKRLEVTGRPIRYIDWLFPGILGMNIMFSALWGVGYVVVRYRKNGALKRLKATPLTAFEYLTAITCSRLFLLVFTVAVVWTGCDLIFDFHVEGRYLDLAILFVVGALSMTSMGLVLASRGTSEEFTTGLLNFISWPMMFLSEVWFSIEGAPAWVKAAAQTFPLTHLLRAVRAVMNDGASLSQVSLEVALLLAMTLGFLAIGAALFSWTE